ncbi:hypothetical protein ABEB36_004776 [Hypothenemus hampei]|uniref:Uncharacterized protein n=1 Tax=Hypothenemus hampei TaxID=57062 RepID=A0ABD1EWA8_HYPHA
MTGGLSLSKVIHKLKVLFINGTVAELPTDWFKIDIPSVSSDLYILCTAVFIVKVFIAFAQSLFPILRDYTGFPSTIFEKARRVHVKFEYELQVERCIYFHIEKFSSYKHRASRKRRIVPDKVYNIGNTIEIIVNTSTQPRQEVTLKCRQHKPIRFTIEEFTKFADFVFKFMIDDNNDEEDFVYGFMDCEVPKWFDFVIGKYIFLSCWHDGNSYGLAIQDTNNNNDYVTWNKN